MSSIGGGGGGENIIYGDHPAVKVVIINTQYVETDAPSFKSVVQSLTGKDSVIPGFVKSSSSVSKKRSPMQRPTAAVQDGGINRPVVTARGMSFKDLDRLLMEFPSMDEIFQLCADY